MKYEFSSLLKEYLNGFLTEKHTLGFVYTSSRNILNQFDKLCCTKFSDTTTITPELGLSWATKRENEKMSTLEGRIGVIRELARYINRLGLDAFVIPKGMGSSGMRYTPHIFTSVELTKFFAELDNMKINPAAPIQHLLFPVLFRLLYSSGLRPHEALQLSGENVDLKTGQIFIEQSKGHRDRYIVISDDMLNLLRSYRKEASQKVSLNLFFFPNAKGGQICSSNVNRIFRKCWFESGISDPYGNPPRVYDFRHSFATKRLHDWYKSGKDVHALLPYLSAYMGHTHLSATAYYIHLTPEFFPSTEICESKDFESLIPEVCYD